MRQSDFFIKTLKQAPADESSINAQLLLRAGYIDKLMAGVYTFLPLGLKVLDKIKEIVRQEMIAIGANEILMPALQPKNIWQETGRWDEMKDIMFQFKGRGGIECCLGTTHEEPIVDLARKRVQSYKDLPFYLFQIQDKFRNEPRAKSGLLRGREFSMKDLYSFHDSKEELDKYYELVKQAYINIFNRLAINTLVVEASGGSFSKEYSHEFQALSQSGEDTIFYCDNGGPSHTWWAQNKEIAKVKKGSSCPTDSSLKVAEDKAIEIGNIFKLGQKYSRDMNLSFTNKDGKKDYVYMGCYGLGPSRVMGTIVEIHHDDNGIIWPKEISPFQVHLLLLSKDKASLEQAEKLYDILVKSNIDVLYDNRDETPGVKLKESDLLGISVRLIVSEKNNGLIEYKARNSKDIFKLSDKDIIKKLK